MGAQLHGWMRSQQIHGKGISDVVLCTSEAGRTKRKFHDHEIGNANKRLRLFNTSLSQLYSVGLPYND